MKKILCGLVLMVAVLAQAGQLNRVNLLNGAATNGYFMNPADGTNKMYIVNAISATNDLDSTTVFASAGNNLTNLGTYLRGTPVSIPSTSVGVGIGGFSLGVSQTNWLIYTFQKSWDKSNWVYWTNVSFQPVAATTQYTNFNLTIGDYHWMRVYNISNTSAGPQAQGFRSNFLEIYYK